MSKDCRCCNGTARITFDAGDGRTLEHEGTSCNGTGIDGDPRWVLGITA